MSNQPYTGGPDYGVGRRVVGGGNPDPSYGVDRQQSYSLLDGLGRILIHDDFRNGLGRWTPVTAGTGVAAALSTLQGRVFNPPQCVKLDASVANGDISEIRSVYYYERGQRIGFEARLSVDAHPHECILQLFYGPGGSVQLLAQLMYDVSGGQVSVQTPTGFQAIHALPPALFVQNTFLGLKVVIDTTTRKYVRAVIGGVAVDLSAYSLNSFSPGNDYVIDARFQASRVDAVKTVNPVYLGYLTVTVDEP